MALWSVRLDAADLSQLGPLLSDAERAGVARLSRAADRARAALAFGWTRRLLGQRCGIDPRELAVERGVFTKPRLGGEARGVEFSLSHAGDRMLLAVASVPVGVDVEPVSDLPELHGVSELVLSTGEQAELAGLPVGLQAAALLRCWVRKEAVVKGLGAGVACPMAQVVVGSPRRRACLAALPPGFGAAGDWTLLDLDVPSAWLAALAVRASTCRIAWQNDWEGRAQ